MDSDSPGFELDPTLDDNGVLGLQPNDCEADREEDGFTLEEFESEAETAPLDQPMEITADNFEPQCFELESFSSEAADDNLAHTDLSDLSEVEGPDECEMDCEEGRSNSTSPDPLLLFRFAFIIGSTLVSKFGLSHLLQNTWIGRAVAFSSYFSGIGGLEVALAYLNAAFKALASWICFHSLLCFGELVV